MSFVVNLCKVDVLANSRLTGLIEKPHERHTFADTRGTPYQDNYSGMRNYPCRRKKVVAITRN
jgi:hypothetical protein